MSPREACRLAALLLGLSMLSAAHAANVAEGPMLGMLSPGAAKLWMRLDTAAHVRLRFRAQGANETAYVDVGDASAAHDFALKVDLDGLPHDRLFAYSIGVTQPDGSETWTAESYFKTPPDAPANLAFTVLTDFAIAGAPSQALATAAALRPDFLAVIGDMDHSGPAFDKTTRAYYLPDQWPIVLENMRAMHRTFRDPATPIGAQMNAGLFASTPSQPQIPFYEVWDDHDYCANNSDRSCPFRKQAFQAWREYFAWPRDSGLAQAACGGEGVWQRFSVGDVATVFMLDARSSRQPADDLHGPTMLGACQLAWLIKGLERTPAVWKFILSPVPFNPGTKTYDAWSAYNDTPSSDRQQLMQAIRDHGIRNVVVLSGDIHSGGAIDDGTHSEVPEVSVPHANLPKNFVNTYCRYIHSEDLLISQPGTWTLGGLVEPNIGVVPPRCLRDVYPNAALGPLGIPAYPLNGSEAPGFVRVDATASQASIQVLNADGTPRLGFHADGTGAVMRLDLQAQ